jgi:Ciliary BBSome complex subunit 2, middle region
MDIDGDGDNELLAGCDDFELRVFRDEDLQVIISFRFAYEICIVYIIFFL